MPKKKHVHHFVIDTETGRARCIKGKCKTTTTYPKTYDEALLLLGKYNQLGSKSGESEINLSELNNLPVNKTEPDIQDWKSSQYLKVPEQVFSV